MKKIFTLLLSFFSIAFFAQTPPVIEATYFPVKNTKIKQVWDITSTLTVPSAGPNQVWDYRTTNNQFLHPTDTFDFKFLAPSASPYSQFYPSATHATFVRTPLTGISDSIYVYWEINQAGMFSLGGYNIKTEVDSSIINTKKEFYAPNKASYLQAFTDTSYSTGYAVNYNNLGYRAKIKTRKIKTSTYAGYGTLLLPNGSFNDVALIKEQTKGKDSIFVDLLHNGVYTYFTVNNSTAMYYQFLRNNTFGSNVLMYLVGNYGGTSIDYGWYTLPTDFGSITGTVYTNTLETTPVTNGQAYLYRENSNFAKNDILATANLNSSGNYKFDSIPYGEYRIAVRPDVIAYPNYKITYYGDTTNWIDANSIITTTTTSVGHKIHLQMNNSVVGPNAISGQVGLNLNIMRPSSNSQILLVKPIPSIGIVVKKNPGSSAERVLVTDTAGKFNFGILDDGNYTLFVDIPGLHMAGTYNFSVLGGNTVNGLDFTVGTDSIHPINIGVLGIKNNKNTNTASLINAYPNPYTSFATIVLNLPESANVLLEVYNMLGEKVQTLDNSHKQAGNYKYNFSARSLNYSSGMYFVKLTAGNKNNVLKIVEQ
jgi:hypothetical protein